LRFSDLRGHTVAVHAWGPEARDLEAAFREAGVPPAQVRWVSPSSTALALALEHGYLAVLPADAARMQLQAGTLTRVRLAGLPKSSLTVTVAYRGRVPEGVVAVALRALRSLGVA
jgi:DNA-binding transcriptional LysR family regulator